MNDECETETETLRGEVARLRVLNAWLMWRLDHGAGRAARAARGATTLSEELAAVMLVGGWGLGLACGVAARYSWGALALVAVVGSAVWTYALRAALR